MERLEAVEICAGAGGQALGLEKAGFIHESVVEIDEWTCRTLRENRPDWKVLEGDVTDRSIWKASDFEGIPLLAGGVPCPPFSVAGRQLGVNDERDLFAWAVEQVVLAKPQALLLENVRGLSLPRFAGYRQHVLGRLAELGYVAEWKLLYAADFEVPQLRPRFVLVALKEKFAPHFYWPSPIHHHTTVGEALRDMMGSRGWQGVGEWTMKANKIAPTIVGGSKKHGGADLGPTRARRAWASIGVNASSVADSPPAANDRFEVGPRLTTEMVARIQGWQDDDSWTFAGRKTARYRQIGNAFPPPVAYAIGTSIMSALQRTTKPRELVSPEENLVYKILRSSKQHISSSRLMADAGIADQAELERHIGMLGQDFEVLVGNIGSIVTYQLGEFRGFTGW